MSDGSFNSLFSNLRRAVGQPDTPSEKEKNKKPTQAAAKAPSVTVPKKPINAPDPNAARRSPAPEKKPEQQQQPAPNDTTQQAATPSDLPAVVETPIAKTKPTDTTGNRSLFAGRILTALDGPIQIPDETRRICALYDSGLWLVSESHKNSPLVTAVAAQARRMSYRVNEPQYVTPDVVQMAYMQADRALTVGKFDENAMRRRIGDVIRAATEQRANDIHVESSGGKTQIQMRVDGALRVWQNWTQKEGEQFLAAVWSHCDVQSGVTASWSEPMAATISQRVGPDAVILPPEVGGIRCQWMPLVGGRYLNMRINYDGGAMLGSSILEADVDTLGFNEEQTKLARHLRNVPGAMRMIAGPVNQGKTTTLRIMLNRRMVETNLKLNCLVVEDPPEGGIIGARQIGVSSSNDEKVRQRLLGEVLRASLRLDPDIVMLGEVRDFETATMVFRLALTGRQIYTTLHVYSALAIPQRVRDLGIEPYLVYDHHLLRGLFAQRLARKVCTHCGLTVHEAIKLNPLNAEVARRARAGLALMQYNRRYGFQDSNRQFKEPDIDKWRFVNPNHCDKCYDGRAGRTILAEIVEADAKTMRLLSENRIDDAREYWLAPDGMNGISMIWHGLEKIRDGVLSPDDVEFELGPLARENEVLEIEDKLGMPSWLTT